MSEVGWRLILVGSVLLGAGLIAGFGFLRRRLMARAAAALPLDLGGIDGQVLLFSDTSCPSCDVARDRLAAAGVEFREIAYGEAAEVHRVVGITAVPLIVVRGSDGIAVGRIVGKPSSRRLRTLLERSRGK